MQNRKTRDHHTLQTMPCATTVIMASSTQMQIQKEKDSNKGMLLRSMSTEPPKRSSTHLADQLKQLTPITCWPTAPESSCHSLKCIRPTILWSGWWRNDQKKSHYSLQLIKYFRFYLNFN